MTGRTSLGFEVLEGRLVPAHLIGQDPQSVGAGGHEPAVVREVTEGGTDAGAGYSVQIAASSGGWDIKRNKRAA
jgi:hypothetical protein